MPQGSEFQCLRFGSDGGMFSVDPGAPKASLTLSWRTAAQGRDGVFSAELSGAPSTDGASLWFRLTELRLGDVSVSAGPRPASGGGGGGTQRCTRQSPRASYMGADKQKAL